MRDTPESSRERAFLCNHSFVLRLCKPVAIMHVIVVKAESLVSVIVRKNIYFSEMYLPISPASLPSVISSLLVVSIRRTTEGFGYLYS